MNAEHIIEADFRSEIGHRVLVLTCVSRGVSGVADDRGRCIYCLKGAMAS
jgi:hypothetical protein